jgi:ubiquinone/menaquinone biosynthesis C-methylase UbiE
MKTTSIKGYRGLGMEGLIAKWYASTTRKGLDEYQILARRVAQELAPGSKVLEVAPGPGYFAVELAKLGNFQVAGLYISRTFVEIARKNAEEARVAVDFRQGNASAMPFENDCFDYVLCRAAFKNFTEPVRALEEMHRVLAKGGTALIIDLRKDAPRESISQYVDGMKVNALNAAFMKLTFRFMLLKRAYTKSDFENFLSGVDFGRVEIRESLTGLEIELQT